MALPDPYIPAELAAMEEAVRQAIADIFLSVAIDYGFTANHVWTTYRAAKTPAEFYSISMIEDPDSIGEAPENRRRLERHFYIDYMSMRRSQIELTITYGIHIYMGFKDEYALAPAGRRSFNELYALNMKFSQILADNQELGLNDSISHGHLQGPSKPRWLPQDEQGNTTTVMDDTLAVTLKVC